jgi:hypothetical protein
VKAAFSIMCGVCVAVVLATALAFPAGGLRPWIAQVSLLIGTFAAAACFVRTRAWDWKRPSFCWFDWAALLLFALFAARSFLWLVFQANDQLRVFSPNNIGDMSLHLSFIRYLADGAPFWPENPIYSGESLRYPIGSDIFNALLTLIGVSDIRGLIWCGLVASAVLFIALRNFGGSFLVAAFLCNGGVAGFAFLQHYAFADYQAELAWKSIPLAMWITQRGLLYAIPVGLMLLTTWRDDFAEPGFRSSAWRIPFPAQVLLYSTMPLFHLHTFLFLSGMLGLWLLLRERAAQRGILKLILWSLAPATVLVAIETDGFRAAGGMHMQPGWMQGDQNFIAFWFMNFGILPICVAVLAWRTIADLRNSDRSAAAMETMHWLLPSLVIFSFTCVVMLSSWEWDNTKLMIWPYFIVMSLLGREIAAWRSIEARVLVCFGLFFSGLVSLLGGIGSQGPEHGYEIARRSDLDGAAHELGKISVSETFAGASTYNHPVLLSGHKMAMGYTGHLWSYGIDFQERERRVAQLLNGDDGWEQIARDLSIRWIFWGHIEEEKFPESKMPWKKTARLFATGDWGSIYDLSQEATPVPTH